MENWSRRVSPMFDTMGRTTPCGRVSMSCGSHNGARHAGRSIQHRLPIDIAAEVFSRGRCSVDFRPMSAGILYSSHPPLSELRLQTRRRDFQWWLPSDSRLVSGHHFALPYLRRNFRDVMQPAVMAISRLFQIPGEGFSASRTWAKLRRGRCRIIVAKSVDLLRVKRTTLLAGDGNAAC